MTRRLDRAFLLFMQPVRVSDPLSLSMLLQFADAWARGKPTAINVRFGNRAPANVLELQDLCTRHNIIDLYLCVLQDVLNQLHLQLTITSNAWVGLSCSQKLCNDSSFLGLPICHRRFSSFLRP